jgi:16S rRNA C967 or C1407 C5-methylase (RsmB/RsmF family)
MQANAFAKLARGARLVYSTCAIKPEENEEVVRRFLNGSSMARAGSRRLGIFLHRRIFPHVSRRTDGFLRHSFEAASHASLMAGEAGE